MISSKYVKHPVSHFMVITHEILPEIYIAIFLTKHITSIAIFVILWVLDYYSYVTLLMLINAVLMKRELILEPSLLSTH